MYIGIYMFADGNNHNILQNNDNTNKYSAIYKHLLSLTKLYTLMHNVHIDVYNFVDDNKGQQHTEIDNGKLIFYNI